MFVRFLRLMSMSLLMALSLAFGKIETVSEKNEL